MPEKLSIGRQAGALESAIEPFRNLVRRAAADRPEGGAAQADRIDLHMPSGIVTADEVRLEVLAAQVEERRYFVPAELLSRRLLEEHLAGHELWRSLAAR